MKKSKLTSKSKRKKSQSPPGGERRKPAENSSKAKEQLKAKDKKKLPRKSRWEVPKSNDTSLTTKQADLLDPIVAVKMETAENSSRILEMLNEKETIVEHLFFTVTGNALEELIPDYLKKRSLAELKKLCLEELKKMSNDDIIDVISGAEHSALKDQETQTDANVESKETNVADENITENDKNTTCDKSESDDVPKSIEMNCSVDEENQSPEDVLEEVAKDLGVSDGDAELLELEMRARAIRSLLKMKSSDSENTQVVDKSS